MSPSTSIPNNRSPQESQDAARQAPNFQLNAFYLGDNLGVLRSFDSGTVDLIATDPPFNKKRDAFEGELKGGGKAKFKDNWHWVDPDPDKGRRHDPDAIENHVDWLDSIEKHHHRVHALITATRDVYGDDMAAFLCWLGVRILEMHRVLKPTGSLYLHLDHTAHAYVKALMDAVFGQKNFLNAITWPRYAVHSLSAGFDQVADVLLMYSKGDHPTLNRVFDVPSGEEMEKRFPYVEAETGRRYQHVALEQSSNYVEGDAERIISGKKVVSSVGWRWTQETFDKRIAENPLLIHWTKNGRPRYKLYMDEYKGSPLGNIWTDIPYLAAGDKERTGYPTQKPLALYKRIVRASSNPGDIVLDPFAGCATTAVAAQSLRRNWVAIDIEAEGYNLTKQRMSDERALDQQTIAIGPAITDLPARMDDGRTEADPLNPEPRKQRPPSKIDKDRDRKLDILIAEFGLQCWGCGFTPPGDAGQLHGRDFFELDHIRPQSDRGTHDILNRAILCGPCNKRKGGFGGTLTDLREQNETAQRLYGRLLDMTKVVDWHARYEDGEEERLV